MTEFPVEIADAQGECVVCQQPIEPGDRYRQVGRVSLHELCLVPASPARPATPAPPTTRLYTEEPRIRVQVPEGTPWHMFSWVASKLILEERARRLFVAGRAETREQAFDLAMQLDQDNAEVFCPSLATLKRTHGHEGPSVGAARTVGEGVAAIITERQRKNPKLDYHDEHHRLLEDEPGLKTAYWKEQP